MIEKLLGRELLVQNKCQILLINCLLFALTKSGDSQICPTVSNKLSLIKVVITIVKLCVD